MKSIIVLGGGTAGWMAAAYLNRVLGCAEGGQPMSITVVESADIGTIGVGEATIPTLRTFLGILQIPEWEFLAETNATLKHGIRFRNWLGPSVADPEPEYYHLFENLPSLEGFSTGAHWLALRDRGLDQPPFWEATGVTGELCRRLKSPKPYEALPYESPFPYAYHIDASRFGDLLRKTAVARGVQRVCDTVEKVNRTEDGRIGSLMTREHGLLQADFYIDASGFRSVLIEGALAEPFVDWSDYLFCDRAVACQLPHEQSPPVLRPYTTSTARDAGWIWEIDLFSRRGNGYVYSSRHTNTGQAELALREHLGPAAQNAALRHLTMRVGHRRKAWSGNCLAIGLAGGFLEPLESTGIYLVEIALSLFVDYLGGGEAAPYFAERFNAKMTQIYEELRDFIQIHYILSDREDSAFWRDYRHEVKVPESLREKLALWTFKLPASVDLDGRMTLFGPSNYAYILAGMNQLPPGHNHLSPFIRKDVSLGAMTALERNRLTIAERFPTHLDYLRKQRAVGRISFPTEAREELVVQP
jgi:flavin-dependent dehydrogenase